MSGVRFQVLRHVETRELIPVISFDETETFANMTPEQFSKLGGFLALMSLMLASAKKEPFDG